MFRLNSVIAPSSRVNEYDVIRTKQIFSDFGLYPKDRDIFGFTDNELFDGIRDFQSANNLKVDGIIKPVGETIDAINDWLGGVFGTADRRTIQKHFSISAFPLKWGEWVEVFAQAGVARRDPQNNVTRITVSLSTQTQTSSFDYEIKGGDHFIRGVSGSGGASEMVTITGNVATSISVRARGHGVATQRVLVTVQ